MLGIALLLGSSGAFLGGMALYQRFHSYIGEREGPFDAGRQTDLLNHKQSWRYGARKKDMTTTNHNIPPSWSPAARIAHCLRDVLDAVALLLRVADGQDPASTVPSQEGGA